MEAQATSTTAAAGDAKAATTATAASTETKAAETTVKGATEQSMLEGSDKAGETKAAEGETKGDAGESKDAKAETKPALVDEKWEPPAVEGVTRDPKVVADVRALLVKHKVSAELAKDLFGYADAQAVAGAKAAANAAEVAKAERRAADFKVIEADKELGGAKLDATKADYHRAVRALGGKELADALRSEGIENMPAIVRAFVKAGRSLAEDTVDGTAKDVGKSVGNPFDRHVRAAYPLMHQKKES